MGDAPSNIMKRLEFAEMSVAGNFTVQGGGHRDIVVWDDDVAVGGNVALALRGGQNLFDSSPNGVNNNTIGGNLRYAGGAGHDTVYLDSTTIGKNAAIALGESPVINQRLYVGHEDNLGVCVYGSLNVTAGANVDLISLRRLYVGNGATIATGAGDDSVFMNDVDVAGPTQIAFGGGDDRLYVEMLANDATGLLDDDTTFGGKFTVRAGGGDDLVNFSKDMDPTTFPRFGAKVSLQGGGGDDTLDVEGYPWSVTGNFSDFETGSVP
jgi:hypothetical protein